MIKYKTETEMIKQQVFDKFICDRCKKELSYDDTFEIQEVYSIYFVGGYGSVFGDMDRISCDLCQQCLKELIGDFCIYNAEELE